MPRCHQNSFTDFYIKGKLASNFIKIQFCEAKISVMRVGSRRPATFKIEIFVTIVKETVKNSHSGPRPRFSHSIIDIIVSRDN